jgi:hypothetical protein
MKGHFLADKEKGYLASQDNNMPKSTYLNLSLSRHPQGFPIACPQFDNFAAKKMENKSF